MSTIKATWKSGYIVLDDPVDWPDGLRLLIAPVPSQPDLGRGGDDGPMTPEEITHTLAAMDRIEPMELTAEQAADLEDWERKVNEYTISNLDKGIEDVFR